MKSAIAAAAALASPAVVAIALAQLDQSAFRHAAGYAATVPIAVFASLAAALLVPAFVIWRLPYGLAVRLGASVVALGVLAVELYATFFFVIVRP